MRIAKAILFLYAVVYRKAASGSFQYCQMNRKETVTTYSWPDGHNKTAFWHAGDLSL